MNFTGKKYSKYYFSFNIVIYKLHKRIKIKIVLPNQELSVLYGGPTLNYGEQLSLYVPLYAARKYDRRVGTPAIV